MSSSRVVAGPSVAAAASVATGAGAATTGAATTAGAAATFLLDFLVSTTAGATAATTGAGVGAGAATSSVFLATRFLAGAEELEAEFIILVPVEELEDILRTESWNVRLSGQFFSNFHQNLIPGHTDLLLFFEIREVPAVIPSQMKKCVKKFIF